MSGTSLNRNLKKMIYAAFFLALALVLPFLTGQLPELGKVLNPMHIPVFMCGFVAGAPLGGIIGAIAPLLRMLLFGAPTVPTALSMALELAVYGAASGIFYRLLGKKISSLYVSLFIAMVLGRIAFCLVSFFVIGLEESELSFLTYFVMNFATAVPGLVVQLLLVPSAVIILEHFSLSPNASSQ